MLTSIYFKEIVLQMVGAPEKPLPINVFNLLPKRRNFAGSATGGIETQEMLDFCAKHNILAEVEMIEMSQVNEAFEKLSSKM